MTPTRRTIQGLSFDFHGPSYAKLIGPPDWPSLELAFNGEIWHLWGERPRGHPKLLHFHRNRDNLIGILAYVFGTADALPEGYIDRGPFNG